MIAEHGNKGANTGIIAASRCFATSLMKLAPRMFGEDFGRTLECWSSSLLSASDLIALGKNNRCGIKKRTAIIPPH